MQEFMRKIRENIKQATFQEFKKEFLKNHKKITKEQVSFSPTQTLADK